MLKITHAELLALKPCAADSRAKLFHGHKYVNVEQALAGGTTIRDVLWVAGKLGRKDLCVAFALACAVHVENLDKTGTAKPCNDATAVYVAAPTAANFEILKQVRRAAADAAAYAAAAAADAADAAAAAYAAADADADAAAAAAYAADAAADAAYAAAAAARKKETSWQEKKLIEIFGG